MPRVLKPRDVAALFGVGVDQLRNIHLERPIPGHFWTKGGQGRWWDSCELRRRAEEKRKLKAESQDRTARRTYRPMSESELAQQGAAAAKLFHDIPYVRATVTGMDFSAVPDFAMADVLNAVGKRLQMLHRATSGDPNAVGALAQFLATPGGKMLK